MHLILSILAGLAGSVVGAAARAGVDAMDRQLRGEGPPEAIVVNASPVAGVVAGVLGLLLGARRAFWLGAVLTAAGADRLDKRVLGRAGIDLDALVAKAQEAASRARSQAAGGEGEAEPAV